MADVPSNLIPTRVTQLPLAPVADENSLMMIVYQGNNYQIRVGDLLSVAGVPITRQVIAGTGMTGGGQLSSNVTLSIANGGVGSAQLANSGVTPGTYGNSTDIPVLTVDNTGRVVAATTIPATISGYVPTTREVIAGTGLTGGGPLNTNVTLNANLSNATPQVLDNAGSAGVSTEISRADHQHPAVDLSDQAQINGILPMDQGGTARSLVPNAGAVVWSGADGLYIGPAGVYGQVLTSGGTNQPIWASIDVDIPRPANTVRAGPVSGPDAIPTFRLLVNDDIPDTLDGKTLTNVDINSGTIDGTTIGATTPSTGAFSQLDVDNVRIDGSTISSTNTDGNINLTPNGTGSVVVSKADINSGTIDNTVIGGVTPVAASFTNITGERIDLDTTPPAQTDQEGRMYWNSEDNAKTLSIGMAGGQVVQQVGEDLYYRVKAQGAIANGDVVMFAGTVGASGGLIAAKATGLTVSQTEYVMGVATENIANNSWGYITFFGEVKGVNTTGGPEAWVDGQILYYNPAVAGGLTKNKPAAPNPVVIVAAVVHAASNGVLFVRPTYGSALGQTDGNVSFGTLSNGDIISYDSALQYWKNVAQSTLSVGSATTATNLAGGAVGDLPYQSGAGATSFLAAGTASYVLQANGAAAPTWVAQSTLSVGSASTATSAASATTASNLAGGSTGAIAYNSGAGTTTFLNLGTTDYVLTAGATAPQYTAQSSLSVGSAGKATNLAGGALNKIPYQTALDTTSFIDAPTVSNTFLKWNGATFAWDTAGSGTVTSVDFSGGTTGLTTSGGPVTTSGTITLAGTLAIANGGSGQTSAQAAMNAFAGAVTSGHYLRGNGTNVVMSAIQAADVPTLNQNTTGQAGSVANAVTFNSTGGASPGTTFNGSAARTIDYSTVGAPKTDGTGASGTWGISINGNAATATSATTATNLGGGVASQIPYQTGAGTTSFIANGTAGQVLLSNGTSAPSWGGVSGGTF